MFNLPIEGDYIFLNAKISFTSFPTFPINKPSYYFWDYIYPHSKLLLYGMLHTVIFNHFGISIDSPVTSPNLSILCVSNSYVFHSISLLLILHPLFQNSFHRLFASRYIVWSVRLWPFWCWCWRWSPWTREPRGPRHPPDPLTILSPFVTLSPSSRLWINSLSTLPIILINSIIWLNTFTFHLYLIAALLAVLWFPFNFCFFFLWCQRGRKYLDSN